MSRWQSALLHTRNICGVAGDEEEIHFTRSIVPTSASETTFQSQYKIDGRTVTWDAYNAKLKSFGILVKARNFLVFQVHLRDLRLFIC